jgi:ATP-dependent DNA helicase RecQ
LTATATPDVIDDIQEKLHFRERNVFCKSFERKNIAYVIRETDDKLYEIVHILSKMPGSAIVYIRSRKRTKEIAIELQRQGIDADFFHAGLTSDEKIKKQNAWKNNQCRVIVCTNAFGMGIDKPDVRTVIHYELPSSLEEYFQEAGRAGRDEEKAYAVALYSPRDNAKLKKRISDEFPERDFIKDVYEKLAYFFQIAINTGIDTGHNFHLDKFCMAYRYSMTQVHSALKILDLSGYIEYIEEADKQSRLLFTIQRDELYKFSGYSPAIENLIQVLLRSYTGLFADYIHINETLLAQRTGMDEIDVYEALKLLSKQHVIHYIPTQKVPTIYYNRNREELKYLSIPQSVYEQRREKLIHRIKHVIEYGSSQTQCRSKMLLQYFGEKGAADCGKCDVCLSKKSRETGSSTKNKIQKEIRALLENGETTIDKITASIDCPEKLILESLRFLSDNDQLIIKDNKVRKK